MADDCIPKVKEQLAKLAGVKVSDAQLKRVLATMEAIKEGSSKDPSLGTYQQRTQAYFKRSVEDQERRAAQYAKDMRAHLDNLNQVSQEAFKGSPDEAILNLLVQPDRLAKNVADSVENKRDFFKGSWENLRNVGIEKLGLKKVYLSGALDQEIRRGIHALRTGADTAGINGDALALAKIHVDVQKKMLQDQNMRGIRVGNLSDRIEMQRHNPEALIAVGFDGWRTRIMNDPNIKLDRERTFGEFAGDADKENEILQSIYRHVIAGKVDEKFGQLASDFDAYATTRDPGANLSDRLGRSRALHFLDADSSHYYNESFGQGTLAENLQAEIATKSRYVALVDKFGSEPETAFYRTIDDLHQRLVNEGKLDEAKKLRTGKGTGKDAYAPNLRWRFNEIAGLNESPVSESLARVGTGVRLLESAAKLGRFGLASMTNYAQAVVRLKDATGHNVITSGATVFAEYLKAIPPGVRREVLQDLGQVADDLSYEILRLSQPTEQKIGSSMMRFLSSYSAANYFTDAPKVAFGNLFMRKMADVAANPAKMSVEMRASLLTAGIEEADVRALSGAVQSQHGRKQLTLEGIRDLTDEQVSERAKAMGMKPAEYRYEMELRYGTYLNTQIRMVSTTAGARETGLLSFGTQTGTYAGEILRMITQFKAFGLQGGNLVLSTMRAKPNERALLERGVLLSQGNNMSSVAQMLLIGTTLGYAKGMITDAMDNKEPNLSPKPGDIVEAMARSGVGGIFTDMAVTPYSKFGPQANIWSAVMGPALGTAIPTIDAAMKGGRGGTTPALVKELRSHIPLQNAFLFKQGFDYLQYNGIMDALKPGSSSKRERAMRKNDRKEGTERIFK